MIDEQKIRHMASLSKLALTDEQIPLFQDKFKKVMTILDKIADINTDSVEPMHNPLDATSPLREDSVTEKNNRDALLSQAPSTENGLFKVPKVIE